METKAIHKIFLNLNQVWFWESGNDRVKEKA